MKDFQLLVGQVVQICVGLLALATRNAAPRPRPRQRQKQVLLHMSQIFATSEFILQNYFQKTICVGHKTKSPKRAKLRLKEFFSFFFIYYIPLHCYDLRGFKAVFSFSPLSLHKRKFHLHLRLDHFSSKLSQIPFDSQTQSGLPNSHESGPFFPSGAVSLPPSLIPPSPSSSPSRCCGEPLPLSTVVIWQEILKRRRCANCPETVAVRSWRSRGPTPASY